MRRRIRIGREKGFSLVEVLAALGVFALVTLGVVPLLGAALRGTTLSRSETVSQNTARQMMERIQGLKWFTSWQAKAANVDLLDLFYPQAGSGGYGTVSTYPPLLIPSPAGYGAVYTTTCPDAANPACGGITLPDGYTMTIKVAFVKAKAGTTPQAYEIVNPSVTAPVYDHDSTTGADQPPAQLVDVNILVNWNVNGKARTFQLRSIIGEHRFVAPGAVVTSASPSPSAAGAAGVSKVRATSTNDYIYQVQTGFSSGSAGIGCPTPPCTSDLEAVIGNAFSTIQAGDTVTADSTVNTAKVSVARSYQSPQVPPPSPPPDLATLNGISKSVHAPPLAPATGYCLPNPNTCTAQTTTTHPDLGTPVVAGMSGTRIGSIYADVPNGNPTTNLNYTYRSTSCSSSTPEQWFWNPHTDVATNGYLRMDTTTPLKNVFHSTESGCLSNFMRGSTSAAATALTPAASRAVTATTTQDMSNLHIFRVNYGASTAVKWSPFRIDDWTASVSCTAKPGGGATATGSWTAIASYRLDNLPNNNQVPSNLPGITVTMNSSGNDTLTGQFVSGVTSTVTTPNALSWLQQNANNPLIYDGSTTALDLYLFNDPLNSKKGYLDSAVEDKTITTSVSPDGRSVNASINGAIRIDTNQVRDNTPDSAFNVAVGKLSCDATDNR